MSQTELLAEKVRQAIATFLTSNRNSLGNQAADPAFDAALVGFARGDDPIFVDYKEHVGPFHWTPLEAMQQAWPDLFFDPADITVISWVLPQTARTRAENRRETFYPSESWARARFFGETVNDDLRRQVVAFFASEGIRALAPVLLPNWSRKDSERFVWASTWSERHQAYAAGLGTFALCDGLITPKGKAMRVGSVVAHTNALPVSPRPYADHHAYCLFYNGIDCRACIDRCPVGAISESGHDKRTCRAHVHLTAKTHVKAAYGFDGYGCGLCQTGVPCEAGIPAQLRPKIAVPESSGPRQAPS